MTRFELQTAWQPPDHWSASTAIAECQVHHDAGNDVRPIYRQYVQARHWLEQQQNRSAADENLLADVRMVVTAIDKLLD
ncbi:hypothetical protein [Stenotrophomonas sp.]|uniref:hypothetical protein n=1 Tax=Stenotrophomonas sp. TaxID=69392 RepID=UPI0028AAC87A|nr:hypothetical protein [Stenotrophomonas sp.]